jgi:hypothetical protein
VIYGEGVLRLHQRRDDVFADCGGGERENSFFQAVEEGEKAKGRERIVSISCIQGNEQKIGE